jgi:hypothetical protein
MAGEDPDRNPLSGDAEKRLIVGPVRKRCGT